MPERYGLTTSKHVDRCEEVLNDTTFAPDGSAYVTDSVNPVFYRLAPTTTRQYELQEFLKFDGTVVTYVNAAGAKGINVNGIVATADGRYLIIGKRNENKLFRVNLKSREIVPVNMPAGMLNTPDTCSWKETCSTLRRICRSQSRS